MTKILALYFALFTACLTVTTAAMIFLCKAITGGQVGEGSYVGMAFFILATSVALTWFVPSALEDQQPRRREW